MPLSPEAYRALATQLGAPPEEFPHPLYVVDRVGRVVFCNEALARVVGRPAHQIVGRLSLLLYPPEVAPVFLRRRVRALLGEALPPRILTHIRTNDARKVPVQLTITSLVLEGELFGRVAVVRETREPIPAAHFEYQLYSLEDEADTLPYGLITLDPSGAVIGYNAAESRLSGFAKADVLGRNFFADIAPCTRVRGFAGLYRQMVETGKPESAQFEFVFRFPYGEKRVIIRMTYSHEAKQGVIVVEQRPDVAP